MSNDAFGIKIIVAGRQAFKCANKPDKVLKGLETYKCPLWQLEHEDKGSFTDELNNLQALCNICHSAKTRLFTSVTKPQLIKELVITKKNEDCLLSLMKYLCSSCGYSTNIKPQYDRHMVTKKHYDNLYKQGKIFKCWPCGAYLLTEENLNEHQETCVNFGICFENSLVISNLRKQKDKLRDERLSKNGSCAVETSEEYELGEEIKNKRLEVMVYMKK